MRKYFLLLFFILPLISFSVHKFYLSVTEMEYDSREGSLEITSRVFTDDLEAVLRHIHGEDFTLTRRKEHPSADEFIEKYLRGRLEIILEGRSREFHFLGKKYDKDQLVLFMEIEDVRSFESIEIRNRILTGYFPDQKNIVHVEQGSITKSLLLTRNEERGLLNFSNE